MNPIPPQFTNLPIHILVGSLRLLLITDFGLNHCMNKFARHYSIGIYPQVTGTSVKTKIFLTILFFQGHILADKFVSQCQTYPRSSELYMYSILTVTFQQPLAPWHRQARSFTPWSVSYWSASDGTTSQSLFAMLSWQLLDCDCSFAPNHSKIW